MVVHKSPTDLTIGDRYSRIEKDLYDKKELDTKDELDKISNKRKERNKHISKSKVKSQCAKEKRVEDSSGSTVEKESIIKDKKIENSRKRIKTLDTDDLFGTDPDIESSAKKVKKV